MSQQGNQGITPTQEHLENLARCKDPLNGAIFFIENAVYTLDQVDAKNPIKRFPIHKPYLRLYIKLWLKFPHIAIPKSRRMVMSWTNITLYLWDALFNNGRFYGFVSKKEEDSGELVDRAEFIYDHIPEEFLPKALLPKKKRTTKPPVLSFPETNSKIQGFPMGANQLRQFTFSGLLGDECAFWPEAQKFYSASRPTLDGGGRMTLISSRAPGFFKRLVYDQLDVVGDVIPKAGDIQTPMQGIELWVNPKNGFLTIDIHYTADEEKRDPSFAKAIKASMPIRDYLMEYERNWETFEGLPVFEDFSKAIHESKTVLEPHLGLPLLLGWDFGRTPACVVAQLQGDQVVILKEYVEQNMGIERFAPKVMNSLRLLYPEWTQDKDFISWVDPSGFDKGDKDERTCVSIMQSAEGANIKDIRPGLLRWEPRRAAVNKLLLGHNKNGSLFKIHEATAPMLFAGFAGGYRYAESLQELEPKQARPLKDKHSHPHDGFQYLAGGIQSLSKKKRLIKIPTPQYSITKGSGNEQKQDKTGAARYGY